MTGIIGTENAGFNIIEAMRYDPTHGYCIGRSKNQYVTWWFCERIDGTGVSFYHGNYFPIDWDAPMKSAARVKADYCRRLMEAYENLSRYGA